MQVEKLNEEASKPAPPETRPEARDRFTLGQVSKELRGIVGFAPTKRTRNYVARRLSESKLTSQADLAQLRNEILGVDTLSRFKTIFTEVVGRDVFSEKDERDVDLINALNYGLVRRSQGEEVADAGARDVLTRRLAQSGPTHSQRLIFRDGGREPFTVRSAFVLTEGTTLTLHDGTRWTVDRTEPVEPGTDDEAGLGFHVYVSPLMPD